MLTLEEINAVGKKLEELFCLCTAPMAIKLIDRDEATPSYSQAVRMHKEENESYPEISLRL